jgi:hypothetical protein
MSNGTISDFEPRGTHMNPDTRPGIAMRRVVAASLILLSSLILAPTVAVACTCAAFPDDEEQAAAIAYARADVVFLGAVTHIKTKRWARPVAFRETTFEVRKAWKGLSGRDPAVVWSALGSLACGYKFDKPGEYLVFAYWDVEQQVLTTSLCDLTREASIAAGLIRELDKLSRQNQLPGEK